MLHSRNRSVVVISKEEARVNLFQPLNSHSPDMVYGCDVLFPLLFLVQVFILLIPVVLIISITERRCGLARGNDVCMGGRRHGGCSTTRKIEIILALISVHPQEEGPVRCEWRRLLCRAGEYAMRRWDLMTRYQGIRRAGELVCIGIVSVGRRRCDRRNVVFVIEEVVFLGSGVG